MVTRGFWAAGEFLPRRAKGKGEKNEPRDADPAGYELLPPANIMGQVSGYHPIKTLDPDFVLPILR